MRCMSSRTVAVQQVRAALGGARRLGLDSVPLLQRAGIPPLTLGDERARVTAEQFALLVRAVQRATGDEFMGLGTVPSRPGTFAMMCYASIGCRDLGTALERAVRFYGLFPGGPDLVLERGGEEAEFAVRNDLRDHAEGRFLAECVLVIWHRLASWLIGRRIPLRRVRFDCPPPPHAGEYGTVFDCPVGFGPGRTYRASVRFDARWLAAVPVRDEAALEELLRGAPAVLIGRHEYGTTVTEQVRRTFARALREGRPARLPELDRLAARLAVSPATLRRRLREEGTSYRRLKDQVRREAALAGLAGGREPIVELAARLGFSEDAAFHRAFRRWTGTTPGAYRRGQES